MRFGICTNLQQATELKQGVADYIELNLSHIYAMTEEEIKNALNIMSSFNLSVETTNCFFPREVKLCGKDYDIKKVAEYTKRALFNASILGIDTCVLGSGGARNIDEGENKAQCIKQIEEAIYTSAEIAKGFGITIAIEPLNKNECNMINTLSEGAEWCKKLSHPNVMLLADIYHMSIENETYEHICKYGNVIKHIHISRPESKFFPNKNDGFDYSILKNIIDRANYNSRISIEARCDDNFAKTASESLEFLKSIFC